MFNFWENLGVALYFDDERELHRYLDVKKMHLKGDWKLDTEVTGKWIKVIFYT